MIERMSVASTTSGPWKCNRPSGSSDAYNEQWTAHGQWGSGILLTDLQILCDHFGANGMIEVFVFQERWNCQFLAHFWLEQSFVYWSCEFHPTLSSCKSCCYWKDRGIFRWDCQHTISEEDFRVATFGEMIQAIHCSNRRCFQRFVACLDLKGIQKAGDL